MDEVFAFGDFSQDEVQKLYDVDSRPVEFTKTERVNAGVVRERTANHNSVDRNLRRNSTGASSPEFQFPLMAGGLHISSSELSKQIQFLSSSVVSMATGSSVATTSPSSLSTGASVSSVDSPPRPCSGQNGSSVPNSQPRTPSKLNVHAKEFVPSNLSIISSSSVETKNSVLPHLTPPSAVPTSSPSSTEPPRPPVSTKPSAEPEATCEWPTVEELHNPKFSQCADTSNPRAVSSSPPLAEPAKPLATVCEVTRSNGVMGDSVDSRGTEYCSLPSKEAKEDISVRECLLQEEEDQLCSSVKPSARSEPENGSGSGSDGGMAERHSVSPKSLSPRHVGSDPPSLSPPGNTDPVRTSADGCGIDARTRHPLPSPVTSSSAAPSQSQPLALSQSSSASSSSSIPLSSPCPQPPKLKKSWASVVGASKTGNASSTSSHSVSVNEPRRTSSVSASAPDAGRNNDRDKRSSVGNAGRDTSSHDDFALSRLKALGDQLQFLPLRHEPVSIIPRGLQNSGNLCYIHAPLQALLSCPEFFHTLNSLSLPKCLELTSATAATDSMIQLVKKYDPYPVELAAPFSPQACPQAQEPHPNGGRKRVGTSLVCGQSFKPDFVYEMLSRIESSLSTQGRQEDAEEFLGCVLDRLHEEMVSACSAAASASATSSPEAEENEGVADAGDEEEWEEVGPRNKSTITRRTAYSESPVSAIFGGKLQSSVHRLGKKESATVQPFFSLQLDIQNEEVRSVKDAMEALASKEPINLPGMEEIRAFRRVTLAHLPPMLILHIKRFLYLGSSGSQKLTKHISYSTEMEIPKDILAPAIKGKLSPQQRTYHLWAVVYHHGRTPNGGHYTCEVYHPPTESWLRTDDSLIKQIPEDWVHKHSVQRPDKVAYLLFYRRQDTINHRRN